jgi:hypothetical protein
MLHFWIFFIEILMQWNSVAMDIGSSKFLILGYDEPLKATRIHVKVLFYYCCIVLRFFCTFDYGF